MATLFTRIIQGELPSYKVLETDMVYCFLALDQVTKGHTLIVPRIEVDHVLDVPDPHYSEVFKVAKQIGASIQEAFGYARVSYMVQGFEVPHFHLHVLGLNQPSDLDFALGQQLPQVEMQGIQSQILKNLKSN